MEDLVGHIHEKGEAKKQLAEMTTSEHEEVALRIYTKVRKLTASIGQEPVVNRGVRSPNKDLSL